MQYRKIKLSVGIFVIIFFISLLSFSFFLLKEKGTFDKRYTYYFITQNASPFHVGMPLQLSGFNIGIIDDISLRDDGSAMMKFSVSYKNQKWITDGSTLTVKKPLIGPTIIEVNSIMENEPLQPNSQIGIRISDDINDMISKLEPAVERIINIINNINTISSYIAKDDSEVILTIKQIHQISSDIAEITSSLDKKIIDPSSQTLKELHFIMIDVKDKLEKFDSTVDALGSYDKDLLELKEHISIGIIKSNKIIDKVDMLLEDKDEKKMELP
jgi:phospholipid/cholesterol/gamma-HCH transport system substrate-binding protein